MGTRSADGNIQIKMNASISNLLSDGQVTGSASVGSTQVNKKMTNGVSAGNWNRAWSRQAHVLTAGNTEDIDIYDFAGIDIGAGAGNDAIGQAMALEEIVGILIIPTAGTGSLETMPSNPANYWTPMPSLTVAKGNALKVDAGLAMWSHGEDGFDVNDGVSNVIRIGAISTNMTYDLYVFGRHDDNESSSSSTSSQSSSASSSSSSSSSESSKSTSSSSSTSSQSSSSSSVSSQSTSSLTTSANSSSSTS